MSLHSACGVCFSSMSHAEDVALLIRRGLVPDEVVHLVWKTSSNS